VTQAVEKMTPPENISALEFRSFNRVTELIMQRELFKDAFAESVGTSQEEIDHYKWKFHGLSDSPSSYEYGAYFEGKLVGYYAAIPYRYYLHGEEIKSAMVCDVMTHSSMRGKGVFTKLGAYALEQMTNAGLDIAFGYPIRPEVIPGHLKVGWQLSGKLPLQLKVLSVKSALKKHPIRVLTPLINLCCWFYGSILSPRKNRNFISRRFSISEFLSHSESLKFLSSVVGKNHSQLIKTPNFIEWRYGAPKVDYTVVTVSVDTQIVAVAFVRKAVLKNIPTLAIMDLMVLDSSSLALSRLFFEIEKLSSELKTEMIAMMITKKKAKELGLFRFGFIRSPFVFQLITRALSDKITKLPAVVAETFNPMWVDSDDL